jgi:hypothetical protein
MSVRSLAAGAVFSEEFDAGAPRTEPIQWLEEYVPSEAVIAFVAVMAFAGTWPVLGRWGVVAVIGVLVGLLVACDPWNQRDAHVGVQVIAFQTVAALAAYCSWTLLDPHNPLSVDPRVGVGIAVATSVVFSALARSRFGKWLAAH